MTPEEKEKWLEMLPIGDPALPICFSCKNLHVGYIEMLPWMRFVGYYCEFYYIGINWEKETCRDWTDKSD